MNAMTPQLTTYSGMSPSVDRARCIRSNKLYIQTWTTDKGWPSIWFMGCDTNACFKKTVCYGILQTQSACSCGYGNELSNSTKWGKILEYLSSYQLLREDIVLVQLLTLHIPHCGTTYYSSFWNICTNTYTQIYIYMRARVCMSYRISPWDRWFLSHNYFLQHIRLMWCIPGNFHGIPQNRWYR